MSRSTISVRGLESGTITADGDTTMVDRYNSQASQGYAIEAGGYINLAAAGPVTVTVKDSNGLIIYGPTALTADAHVAAQPMGVKLPLIVTTLTQTGDVNVFWTVKK